MTAWQTMNTAPKDGRPVCVAVKGRSLLGHMFHELPYRVRFVGGRWCYVRNDAPVYPWQQPVRWREGA